MRIIIGYGNDLRGEDGFGVEVVRELQNKVKKDTKLIEAYQLTPELCLELLVADEIIFIDAAFSGDSHYKLACILEPLNQTNLSHHISPKMILSILNGVYNRYPSYQIYSMLTNEFDKIDDLEKYNRMLEKVVLYLK